MNFVYTYREASGALREGTIEAESRSAAFSALRSRNVAPISVKECKGRQPKVNQSTGRGRVQGNPIPWVKGSVAGALVVFAAIGLWFVLSRGDVELKPEEKKAPKVEKPKPSVSSNTNGTKKVLVPRKKAIAPMRDLKKPAMTATVTPPSATNAAANVIVYGEVGGNYIFKRPLFKSKSENTIAGILTTEPGTPILDLGLDERFVRDFKNSLTNKIEITDEDTEEDIKVKQMMVDTKAALLEEMNKGGDLLKILQDARNELNELADYRERLRRAYLDKKASSSEEDSDKFMAEANEMLSQYNLPPLKLSKREIERRQRREAQKANNQ